MIHMAAGWGSHLVPFGLGRAFCVSWLLVEHLLVCRLLAKVDAASDDVVHYDYCFPAALLQDFVAAASVQLQCESGKSWEGERPSSAFV